MKNKIEILLNSLEDSILPELNIPSFIECEFLINGRVSNSFSSVKDEFTYFLLWSLDHLTIENDESNALELMKTKVKEELTKPLFPEQFWGGIQFCWYHLSFWLSIDESLRPPLDTAEERKVFLLYYYSFYRTACIFDIKDEQRLDPINCEDSFYYDFWDSVDKHGFLDSYNETEFLKSFVDRFCQSGNYQFKHEFGKGFKNFRSTKVEYKDSELCENGINVIGFPLGQFGLGEDARTTTNAFLLGREKVSVIDVDQENSQNIFDNSDWTKYVSNQEYRYGIMNSPPPFVLNLVKKYGFKFITNKYLIGYCPWEFSTWPEQLKSCFSMYDEVWAPSYFLKETYEKVTNKPVIHMPLAVEIPEFKEFSRKDFSLPEDRFIFLFTFDFNSKLERKNPFAVIRSFKKAFASDEKVSLVIKVMYPNEESEKWKLFKEEVCSDDRITLINDVLTRDKILSLIKVSDAFVSLHRSEGFGRCIAEAMLLKVPCIVTSYSGNMDFCSEDTAYLVDYDLVEVKAGEYIFAEGLKWADPKEKSAVENLKKIYSDSKLRNKIINNAYVNIKDNFSIQSASKRYLERIKIINKSEVRS